MPLEAHAGVRAPFSSETSQLSGKLGASSERLLRNREPAI
jgi:hypothetical protein